MTSTTTAPEFEIPKTMKAVQIERTGGTEVLQLRDDVPVPVPKEGEVLVRNEFVGVNYIDTYFRTGLYPPPHLPYTLGREASGTLISYGPNPPSSSPSTSHPLPPIGSRIAYMAPSTYAQYATTPLTHTIPLPPTISSQTAAASLLQGLTALTLIRDAHPVQRGDWVLVTAASGGVGGWLCQLLSSAGVGARVIAVASSREKREGARGNGAVVAVGYDGGGMEEGEEGGGGGKEGGLVEKVMQLTNGEGVSAVFDSVGKDTFDASLACVGRKGSMVSFGNASGPVTGFALGRLAAKNVKLVRPTLFNYLATREETLRHAEELWRFIAHEGFKVQIHGVYALEEVVRATEEIESRGTMGKLLLRV